MNNSFTINTEVSIFEEFKAIIKSGNYEKVILEIMNSSNRMFPSKYLHNQQQSHGECDFVDIETDEKYDAKLPFCKIQGKLLGSNSGDYKAWIKTMIAEVSEFDKLIKGRGEIKAEELTLYRIIRDRLGAINSDENLILFFPFPIIDCDAPGSIYLQFASNILTVVYDALEKNELVKNRKIFAIYPCMYSHLAIRCLNKRACEYVSDGPLKKYIDYSISLEFERNKF